MTEGVGSRFDGEAFGGLYELPADTGTGEETMRPGWHNCACCPPNVMRILASFGHYLATASDKDLQLHQYMTAHLDLQVKGEVVAIDMESASLGTETRIARCKRKFCEFARLKAI